MHVSLPQRFFFNFQPCLQAALTTKPPFLKLNIVSSPLVFSNLFSNFVKCKYVLKYPTKSKCIAQMARAPKGANDLLRFSYKKWLKFLIAYTKKHQTYLEKVK